MIIARDEQGQVEYGTPTSTLNYRGHVTVNLLRRSLERERPHVVNLEEATVESDCEALLRQAKLEGVRVIRAS